jgi:ParB family transcriptional regulator, chromosome partitioning protein
VTSCIVTPRRAWRIIVGPFREFVVSDGTSQRKSSARQRRGGLGRGLESLIPTAPAAPASSAEADQAVYGRPLDVDLEAISPNPWQPRSTMDEHQLHELAQSIRTHGVMQPLVVTQADEAGKYTLIAGERRWRASRLAGKDTVPVVIKDVTPQSMLELAIVENVVRADLSPLEEAHAYKQLIEDFGLTQADVAERVGRSRVSITNTLRLLNTPERVQRELAEERITEGHARALLGLSSTADQLAVLDIVLEKGLSVRQTEDLVRRWLAGAPARKERDPQSADPEHVRIESRLRDALGTKVALRQDTNASRGTITIEYYSDEQLQALYDRLVGEDLW